MKHLLSLLTVLCFSYNLFATGIEVDIRLYSSQKVGKAVITTDQGLYHLIALDDKNQPLDTIWDIYNDDDNRTFYLSTKNNKVIVNKGSTQLGAYNGLLFASNMPEKEFRIEANKRGRAYHGDIQFSASSGQLQIINKVDIEKYVAGVVESEAGHVQEFEFYKAQAILARTFAIKNITKHLNEGYNLKDDVTSQVYHSKAHYVNSALIDSAVRATQDTILVLDNCEPILGVFHANSGGVTLNSEDVWLESLPYLKSKVDSFSIGTGSYEWEVEISAERFYGYFERMFGAPKNDLALRKALLNFDQTNRHSHFVYKGKTLKLTKVRRAFNLKSTFFSVEQNGEKVSLKGKGFGHGVGLSQDGAIEMSKRGYNHKQILEYYYSGVDFESMDNILLAVPLMF